MISYDEANFIIEKEFDKLDLQIENINLLDAINRVLAADIISDINFPPFTNSAMDGFAITFNPAIKKWKVIGEISAGNFQDYQLGDGLAVSIMTGSKLPETADTVIPIEDVIIENNSVSLKEDSPFEKGINVRLKGNDLLKGEIALNKNIILKPKHISVAASCGKVELRVYKRIKISVLSTGDELVEINEIPSEDKIRSSNQYSLLAAIKEINQTGINLGIAIDKKEIVKEKIKLFLESDSEILITIGGVSVGKYDFVKTVMEDLGIKINFWKVNIKPGKPVVFGIYKKDNTSKLIFGLPGNPVSCLVNFIIFIKNNLLKRLGTFEDISLLAELTESINKKDDKKHFMRGFYTKDDAGNIFVKRVGLQSSGNLAEMGKSNCLIIVDEIKRTVNKGEKVFCIPI